MNRRDEGNDEHKTVAQRAFGRAIRQEMRRVGHIQNPWIAGIAIVTLAGIEGLALWRGIDGALFGIVVAAIAGIAGYTLRHIPHDGKSS